MANGHVAVDNFSIDQHLSEQRRIHRAILRQQQYADVKPPTAPSVKFTSSSSEDSPEDEEEDESDDADLDVDSYFFLQVSDFKSQSYLTGVNYQEGGWR